MSGVAGAAPRCRSSCGGYSPPTGLARILADWIGLAGTALWVGLPIYLVLVLRPALRRSAASWAPGVGQTTVERAARLSHLGVGVTLLSTVAALLLQATSLALATD